MGWSYTHLWQNMHRVTNNAPPPADVGVNTLRLAALGVLADAVFNTASSASNAMGHIQVQGEKEEGK